MTKFENILKGSIKNIVSNKLRSILTMLGLVIGIASVIILVGIGNGTSSQITSQVQSLGTDILILNIQSSDYSLEYSQLDELLELSNIDSVSPYKNVSASVSRQSTTSQASGRSSTHATRTGSGRTWQPCAARRIAATRTPRTSSACACSPGAVSAWTRRRASIGSAMLPAAAA